MSRNWVAFGVVILVAILLSKCNSETVNEKTDLPSLASVELVQMETERTRFEAIKNPTPVDKYNLGYTLVAFNFTPAKLPKGYSTETNSDARPTGLVRTLINKATHGVKTKIAAKKDLERKLKPTKEQALRKGLQLWHDLASKNNQKAIIGLAWYYGKTKDYKNAFYFWRVAHLNGNDAFKYYTNLYASGLPERELRVLEDKVSHFVGTKYQSFRGVLTTKMLEDMKKDAAKRGKALGEELQNILKTD